MKYFYWSVNEDPDKDATLNMSLESIGLLHRFRRQAALEQSRDGKLRFSGKGNNEKYIAIFFDIPIVKYRALLKRLVEANEVIPNGSCLQLVKWEGEQAGYFRKRDENKEGQKRKRERERK